MHQVHYRKSNSTCKQFNLTQCIEDPTHFTGNSLSVIDLLFVKNRDSILTSGIEDPCLHECSLSLSYFWRVQCLKAKI